MVIKTPVPPEKREMAKFFRICEMARADKIKKLVIMDEKEYQEYMYLLEEARKQAYGGSL